MIYSYHIDKIPPDRKSITLVLTKSKISFTILPTKPPFFSNNYFIIQYASAGTLNICMCV